MIESAGTDNLHSPWGHTINTLTLGAYNKCTYPEAVVVGHSKGLQEVGQMVDVWVEVEMVDV